jgi:hypothetical protein
MARSAIGDYVHYTWSGYLGNSSIKLTPFISSLQNSINSTHELIQKHLRKFNKKKQAQELEIALNRGVNLLGEYNGQKNQNLYDEAWKAYIDNVREAIDQSIYDIIDEGLASGQVYNKNPQKERLSSSQMGKGQYLAYNKENNSLKTILQRIEKRLYELKKEVNPFKDSFKIETLEKVLNGLKNDVDKLDNIARNIEETTMFGKPIKKINISKENGVSSVGVGNNLLILRNMVDPKKDPEQAFKYGGFLDRLDALVQVLNGQAVAAQTIGLSLEVGVKGFLDFFINKMDNYANETVLHNIAEVKHLGSSGSQKALKNALFSSRIDMIEVTQGPQKDTNKRKRNDGKGYTAMATLESPDKIDIDIIYNSGKHTGISMKNSNFQVSNMGFEIVGGSPLMYMIQDYNQYNFVNHFLNSQFTILSRNFNLEEVKATEALIHQELKEIILLSALTQVGGITIHGNIKNYPGLFLFRETYPAAGHIGKYANQFRVLTMGELFPLLMENVDQYIRWGNALNRYTTGKKMIHLFDIPSKEGYNEKADDRITWAVRKVRERKITIHITRQAVIEKMRSNVLKDIPK